MTLDRRVQRYYEGYDEADRLWSCALGRLTRLRTWDIFARFLPPAGRVVDIGGGPGTHAAHLAGRGYQVLLLDPVPRHVEQAACAGRSCGFAGAFGDARALPLADGVVDAALLLGPLYHLVDAGDRRRALREAWRVLRPGGRLLAEVITRQAWIIDATASGLLDRARVWAQFELNLRTGFSVDPEDHREGDFWAYFHRTDEVVPELERAGFTAVRLLGVEGFPGLLGNLDQLLEQPDHLLAVSRLVESDPALLGVSPHLIAAATKPGAECDLHGRGGACSNG